MGPADEMGEFEPPASLRHRLAQVGRGWPGCLVRARGQGRL